MARQSKRQSRSPSIRKLRKTLQVLADTTPQTSFKEAGQFICPVCDLPVKPCQADSRATCFHMFREGTELQVLFTGDKAGRRQCLSCGKVIQQKSLRANPTAELCSACTKKAMKARNRSLSKGMSL